MFSLRHGYGKKWQTKRQRRKGKWQKKRPKKRQNKRKKLNRNIFEYFAEEKGET
jgi:hypothetical protein